MDFSSLKEGSFKLQISNTWIFLSNDKSPRRDPGFKVKPLWVGWTLIIRMMSMMIGGCLLYREELLRRAADNQRTHWVKTNRKDPVKVSKHQFIKVRWHTLTSGPGFLSGFQRVPWVNQNCKQFIYAYNI